MNPFDLTGPQFLGLYAALLALCALIAWRLRRSALADHGNDGPDGPLDPYEAAMLTGGPDRMVETVLIRLADEGLEVGAEGEVRTGRPLRTAHPVEDAVARQVSDRALSLASLRKTLRSDPAVAHVRERLEVAGLLPNEVQRAAVRRSGLVFAPLLLLGVARLVRGIALGRPVGFLAALLVATCVLAVLSMRGSRTRRGETVLRDLRTTGAALRTATAAGRAVDPTDAALAFALFGLVAVADDDLRQQLSPSRRWGSHGGGYGSVGGCGSGGGGGCGGGCGG